MKTATVNISFQKDLLEQIDDVAKEESRSRSELIREAARLYIQQKKKWKDIFAYGQSQRIDRNLVIEDVEKEISVYRKKKGTRPV
jgi:metal-responsive CopG/Arc/MetJ family transcriptional regulator